MVYFLFLNFLFYKQVDLPHRFLSTRVCNGEFEYYFYVSLYLVLFSVSNFPLSGQECFLKILYHDFVS